MKEITVIAEDDQNVYACTGASLGCEFPCIAVHINDPECCLAGRSADEACWELVDGGSFEEVEIADSK